MPHDDASSNGRVLPADPRGGRGTRRPGDEATPRPRSVPTPVPYRADQRAAIAREVRAGELERVRRGRYLPPPPDTGGPALRREHQVLRLVAAVSGTLSTDHVFSHETAALLHGLSLYRLAPSVHVSQPWKPPRRATGDRLVRHAVTVPTSDRTLVGGCPVTTLERTVVDCARTLPGERALVIADSALRAGADLDVMAAILVGSVGGRGVRQARRVVAMADARAESPGESLVRWFLDVAGVPTPSPALAVRTRRGTSWVDLGWPEARVAVEFDGAVKYDGRFGDPRSALLAEKRRHDALVEAGWTVLRVMWEDLADPARLVARVRTALAAAERRAIR